VGANTALHRSYSAVISVVIVVERTEEGKELPIQRPVYYLSEMLTLSKQNYPHYQKVAYGVYMVAKKLKHYFEEHPITVVSTTPLSEIIGCKDAMGRVAKWAIELATHTIYLSIILLKQLTTNGVD
jgi:hypothetical protein